MPLFTPHPLSGWAGATVVAVPVFVPGLRAGTARMQAVQAGAARAQPGLYAGVAAMVTIAIPAGPGGGGGAGSGGSGGGAAMTFVLVDEAGNPLTDETGAVFTVGE